MSEHVGACKGSGSNQITEGVIWKQLLFFFFPILFGTFFQQLYNTADAMIVGHFVGKQALAAVGGTTGTLINLLVGFFTGLSSGATVIISQYYGGRKRDKVQWAVHTSVAFSILGGLVLMGIGIIGSRWMLELMNTPSDVMEHALIYIRIYFLGTVGNLLYNMGSGILRAIGDSRKPLYFLIVCCFTNIILDLLLVAALGLGVLGAALATILSQMISAVLVMGALMRTQDIYRLDLSKIRIDGIMLRRIVRIGFPAGMQSVMYSVSNVIIQAGVNGLGTDNVAAWAAYGKVDGLFWMMVNALGISVTTFVGQNYGAGRIDRVHKGVRVSAGLSVIMTSIMCVFLWFGGSPLMSLFTSDEAVRQISSSLLHFMVPTFFTYLAIEILSGSLRGVGDCWIPMVITGLGICGVRILWVIFGLPHYHTLKGAAFCYPLTWVITSIAFLIYYFRFSALGKRKTAR
ncbi:MAG: MATE family efflux transporter [Fusicatenibacter sp.]